MLENDEQLKEILVAQFSDSDILSENKLDRKKIGKIVFSDEVKKSQLEKIIHPLVILQIKKFFDENEDKKLVLVDIPLLFECQLENLFDKILLVYADDKIRFERIKKRNNFEDEYIKQIMSSQFSQEIKKEKSDFIIINEKKTIAQLEKEIIELIEEIK